MGVSPCCRLYETQEGWLQVAALASGQWAKLCGLVGRPDFARYDTFEARVAARAEIESAYEPVFLTRTAIAWFHALAEAGVDVEVSVDSNDGEAVLHDADNERLGLVAEYCHPILGQLRQFGTLIDFSESPTSPSGPPPLVGEHTRLIMERLGYSSEQIEDLLAQGIVYEPTEDYPLGPVIVQVRCVRPSDLDPALALGSNGYSTVLCDQDAEPLVSATESFEMPAPTLAGSLPG